MAGVIIFHMPKKYDLISIGDCVTDTFIELKEAKVHWDKDHERGELSMAFGEKIPYTSTITVAGVGNAANIAVGASRLGLKVGFLTAVGDDRMGDDTRELYKKEGLASEFIKVNRNTATNHHFVLNFEAERTILIKHEKYAYPDPVTIGDKTDWIYFSSLAEHTLPFHEKVGRYLAKHPNVRTGFNPGTFQLRFGAEKLKEIYSHTHVLFVNREEAAFIAKTKSLDIPLLFQKMHALGPKIVVITDGPKGAYASDGTSRYFMPPYPDPKEPISRTGAGDAFSTGFLCALIYGLSLQEALRWAPIESMHVVQFFGAQAGLLKKPALLQFLKKAPKNYQPKII
jgi:sugar/nucleoside kinase (ribokinase family)